MEQPLDRPFLVGERIYLRPLEPEDVTAEYLHWLNDASTARYIMGMVFPATRSKTEQYVSQVLNDPNAVFLAIIEKTTGKHIGNIKLHRINWVDRHAEFGRLIGDSDARAKGYGSEVVQLILNYAFQRLNLHKVFAKCLAFNQAAIRSNEKNGLIVESVLKEFQYVEGKYEDVVIMGINRKTYRQIASDQQR